MDCPDFDVLGRGNDNEGLLIENNDNVENGPCREKSAPGYPQRGPTPSSTTSSASRLGLAPIVATASILCPKNYMRKNTNKKSVFHLCFEK